MEPMNAVIGMTELLLDSGLMLRENDCSHDKDSSECLGNRERHS
jgi:hypothetical protein